MSSRDASQATRPVEQAYFTTTQAAQLTGKSVEALRHAVRRGKLRAAAKGQRGRHREHMFTRAQLDQYITGSDND